MLDTPDFYDPYDGVPKKDPYPIKEFKLVQNMNLGSVKILHVDPTICEVSFIIHASCNDDVKEIARRTILYLTREGFISKDKKWKAKFSTMYKNDEQQ